MAEIIMPKMGDAMTEGKVIRWYKKAGDVVKKGEPVLEIETDKVNLDLEAEADGALGELQAKEGDVVQVGGLLATIGDASGAAAPAKKSEKPKEGAAKPSPKEETKKKEAKPAAESQDEPGDEQDDQAESAEPAADEPERRTTDKKESYRHSTGEYGEAHEMKGPRVDRSARHDAAEPADSPQQQGGERPRSSPLARTMAADLGVNLQGLQGSGPRGRIIAADVKARSGASGARPQMPKGETKQIPLSAMRRTIAKRLAESTGPIPHFYLTVDYDVTSLLSIRAQLIEMDGVKVSVNDFIVRASALALRQHPNINASWGADAITQHGDVHIGIAVATPEGLITPVIRNADRKSVSEIAQEVRALADKAKSRKLKPEDYQGATFTISNLGAWGIEEFTAIINPPNSAILAIGAAEARAVAVDRQVVVRDRMKITMSCDHRVIDGATGAEFLKTMRQYVEQPLRLVL